MVKAFDWTKGTTYDYSKDGEILGWGLRNSVGVAEHPVDTGIWTVENSADDIKLHGVDIHEENPGEEMNFLGYMNGKPHANYGANFGYPFCLTIWNETEAKADGAMATDSTLAYGHQFAHNPNATINDDFCLQKTVGPRLTFESHMAPLDIKFSPKADWAWVGWHGSWDKTAPSGYKVGRVAFGSDGQPTAGALDMKAHNDVIWNKDNSVCPDNCFRPTGLAVDKKGRAYVASDSTGEILIISETQ
jgi:glucose/arabinose dehydrogenase